MALTWIADKALYVEHHPSHSGSALIMIHSSGGNRRHWPMSIRTLPAIDAYALDLPGHGDAGGPGCATVEAYADIVDAFMQQQKMTRVFLMGHSLGGAIVQTLALDARNRPAGIILVGTGARLRVHPDILAGWQAGFETTVDLICRWSFGPRADPLLVDEVRQGFLNTDPAVTRADFSACNRFDLMASVERIDVPTLIVSGAADRLTPPKYGDFLQRAIPHARHVVIEDAGHMMALEKPGEFTRIVADFIDNSLNV